MGYLPACKYHLWYDRIIQQAQKQSRSEYTETHHIIPRSFFKQRNSTGWIDGDPDDHTNLVDLTPREHYLCHKLLVKMTTGIAQSKMVSALWRMANGRKDHYLPPAREYQIIRELAIENLKATAKLLWSDPIFREKQLKRLSSQDRKDHLKIKMKDIRGSEDARLHQRDIMLDRYADTAYYAQHVNTMKVINADPVKRAQQAESNKLLWTDEKRHAHAINMQDVRGRPENRQRQQEINTHRYESQNERELQRLRMLKTHEANPQLREDSRERTSKLWAERSIEEKLVIGSKISISKQALIATGESHLLNSHTCPHCGKVGKGPVMKRHHFDKCKKT